MTSEKKFAQFCGEIVKGENNFLQQQKKQKFCCHCDFREKYLKNCTFRPSAYFSR